MHSILVLGLGELGSAILNALLAHTHRDTQVTITVLLRVPSDPAKQNVVASLIARGVAVIHGDILASSEADLSELFKPFHTVIGCTGMTYPAGTQVKLSRAVLSAGVQRYFPWQFGVDYDTIGPNSSQDLFSEQLEVRALLRGQSKTRWAIVSVGMFTSFLFEPSFGVVSEDRKVVHALGSWENRVTVTIPEDIGRVVAELVWQDRDAEGVVFVAGDTVSYKDVADIMKRIMGQDVRTEEWSIDFLKEELAKDPANGLKKYRVAFAEAMGVAWKKEGTYNERHGLRLETADEYARKLFGRQL
ncbi:saccharopine dehydrogenase-like oxidoreductase [Cylindrobasidium torrendii FP15055 ss-10]|uniref:Saccharopine dehydrogenase-like oxidoreductase n=1 Tax=Cylindrobasidium torrendii FP15055 ss-10 TaxID=1314674 RepID=A0A0D7AT07_9AGAR|nr:saccharopine dehydrogenase-like oxidoreductase [Cylindrobasidium torrendii FP15055 ss-10]